MPSLKNLCHPIIGTIHRKDPIQTNVITTKALFLLLLRRYSKGFDIDQYRSRLSTSKFNMDAVLADNLQKARTDTPQARISIFQLKHKLN
ncbi:hypothetical protein TNIN_445521 [Trichonephila inaurata madagascariensis]|uniref:Uncharacterized protein n=1 Tax=Trichonephila inaurata madagascariensis TaxID=2747483 RepID=A0A8X6IT89_9ARAC|nr:hypothetical protein TNIN_445521 [Trichonephila inaurata madagascariensis]